MTRGHSRVLNITIIFINVCNVINVYKIEIQVQKQTQLNNLKHVL